MNIVYYVSGHGFGHISRSYEVIQALNKESRVEKIFVTTTRKDFVKEKKEKLTFRDIATDVGMIQEISINLDLEKTIDAIQTFERKKKELIESEIEFLEKEKIDIVISDSSSLAFVIADRLKLPSYFIGNFTWDFIYENYREKYSFFSDYSNLIKNEYSLSSFGFILPFHCPMDSIPRRKNIGIIGRSPRRSREVVRDSIGFTKDKKYFLFSFGAYGIPESYLNYENLEDDEWIVVSGYEGLKGEKVIDVKNIYYPDLIGACDYVLTKPGYGILSECYLANTPIIYTDRGDFAEYSYLVDAMKNYHLSSYIPQQDIFDLKFKNAISEIEKQRKTKRIPTLSNGQKDILEQIF